MNELSSTTHGRLLATAMAIAMLGGGSAVLLHSSASVPLMAVSVFAGITLGIVAVALSVEEHRSPLFTTLALILLPVALFLYALAVGLAISAGTLWAGYGFLGLGTLFAGLAALSRRDPVRAPVRAEAH
jgi:hypothetical protein